MRRGLLLRLTASSATALCLVAALAHGSAAHGAPADPRRAHFLQKPPSAPPVRIVSLAPVTTEIAFALGAGDRVVGVTRFCDRPAAAATRPKVGGYVDVNLEAVLALKPDLVLAMPSGGQRALLDQLTARGIPVFVGFADRLDEARDLIAGVGRAVGEAQKGARAVAELDKSLAALRIAPRKTAPRVLVAVSTRPLVVAGRETFAADAVALVGGVNAAGGKTAWPVLSLESLAALSVDVVVAAEGPAAQDALRQSFAALGPRAPRVVAPAAPILMRPGISLPDDVAILQQLVHSQ